MLVGQSEPSFVTWTVSPSASGVVNSRKKELAIRRSRLFLGAYNTRRLNPVPLIACASIAAPGFAESTRKLDRSGGVKLPSASTQSQLSTRAGFGCLVLIRTNSRRGGDKTCSV